ncbi:MmgE/PrpD family protein [Salisediminibacterium beveridgei]|uniref:Immune-responsive protein 1 n=1 Tax=Salisediminibacterium beveridgei TaxID=632773 RepID=A0A1D7QS50_9BACI|nr:MmgE/PrpD family protein [Salisediminibacterium beveridgei]AOM81842.1 Immune-responsive protein 1 [Salisediminibacterium beveridgei]
MTNTLTQEKVTENLASLVAGLHYDTMPEHVTKAAKQHILDGLGNQIAASAIADQARIVQGLLAKWGGKEESTVVGYGHKIPAVNAAFVNAMMGHGVELDDAHGPALTKAGSSIVPSIFAAGEAEKADGKTLIAALVGGYEAAIRVGLAINPSHRKRGYHTSGTAGTFGTAAATARVLGLDAEKTAWTIGTASIQAAGIQAYLKSPSMVKPLSPGKAAFNGVLSAYLSREGLVGPVTALENDEGWLKAFCDDAKVEELTRGHGTEWKILEVGYKPHAACRYAHGPIDCAQIMGKEKDIKAEDIESIKVTTCELAFRQSGHKECKNLNQAMGSTPFGVALALTRGDNSLGDYWKGFEEQVNHDIVEKVEMIIDLEDPGMGVMGRAATVEINLKDGTSHTHRVEAPKGEPEVPMTDDELDEKFLGLARAVLPEDQVRKIFDLVKNLENVEDVSEISKLLVVAGGKPEFKG